MVRIFIVISLLFTSLFAKTVEEKVRLFLGEKEYHIQKNLINIIFQNRNSFIKDSGEVDDLEVLKKLKTSGLLKLFYSKPVQMDVTLITQGDALAFMRVINESLETMGYSYFITKEVIQSDNEFLWKINLETEHIVDPLLFTTELISRGCEVISITRDTNNNWQYNIDSSNAIVKSLELETHTTVSLKKPIKPYWIKVFGLKEVALRSKLSDRWHPSIVFFDKKLHVLRSFKRDEVMNFLKLTVPENAHYMKVSDVYTLDNIKRGLSVYLRAYK